MQKTGEFLLKPDGGLHLTLLQPASGTSQDPPAGLWSRADLEPLLSMMKLAVEEGRYTPDPLIPMSLEPSKAVFDTYRQHMFGRYE